MNLILPDGHEDVRICTVTVLYHIYYINLDVRRNFLTYSYGIFSSLRYTISYPHTMSVYNILLSVCTNSVFTLD